MVDISDSIGSAFDDNGNSGGGGDGVGGGKAEGSPSGSGDSVRFTLSREADAGNEVSSASGAASTRGKVCVTCDARFIFFFFCTSVILLFVLWWL